MTDNITLQTEAIASILSSLDSLQTSYGLPPAKVDTAQLPSCWVTTGASSEDPSEYGEVEITRDYNIQVAVIPTSQGTPLTREKLCRPILEEVKNLLRQHPSLNSTLNVINTLVVNDTGIVILPEWGYKFIGFQVLFRVTYWIKRTYASGE